MEGVQHFKLLGITLSHDINWQAHTDAIITKASSRVYFLKILKKSGLQSHQLQHFYLSVIRPILEYCSPIWHHGLTKAQAKSLEAIQRRTLRIISKLLERVVQLRLQEFLDSNNLMPGTQSGYRDVSIIVPRLQ